MCGRDWMERDLAAPRLGISPSNFRCTRRRPSARFGPIVFLLAPRLPRPIQHESQSIENVAAEDADLFIDHEKLTSKCAAEHQQFSADGSNGARSAVER